MTEHYTPETLEKAAEALEDIWADEPDPKPMARAVLDATAGDIAARALEEAANDWQRGEWANAPRRPDRIQERIANGQHVGDWLRDRAARLREGGE